MRVSIVVPCYNQGHFLPDVISSVESCDSSLYELIIVNDGSTDAKTNEILKELSQKGYKIIFQENKGLAGARNAGIELAKGDLVLPLDADNKVRPEYLTKAIEVFDSNPEVAVVYGNANYFGEKTGTWKPGEFNLQRLMIHNYIDACAVIRKSVLLEVGGYDTKMKFMGWEDWDMWLGIGFRGHQFRYVDEVLFDYRVRTGSMGQELYDNYAKPNFVENYVNDKHKFHMGHDWITHHFVSRFKQSPVKFLIKLFMRAYFSRYYLKLLKKNKIRNGI